MLFIYRCVGFGVARFDIQAMPEPLNVGRVTRELPTLFVYMDHILKFAK